MKMHFSTQQSICKLKEIVLECQNENLQTLKLRERINSTKKMLVRRRSAPQQINGVERLHYGTAQRRNSLFSLLQLENTRPITKGEIKGGMYLTKRNSVSTYLQNPALYAKILVSVNRNKLSRSHTYAKQKDGQERRSMLKAIKMTDYYGFS